MPKMTLLDMTQNILSAMESDEVNSISDTVESLQVAQSIVDTYYDLFGPMQIPSREGIVTLQASLDITKPNYMTLPDNVLDIKWIKYNFRFNGDTDYQTVTYVSPEKFLQDVMPSAATNSNTMIVTDDSGAKFTIYTDNCPTYWTTFDNKTLIFNSYDASLDATLQSSQTLCWGQFDNKLELVDDAVPELDPQLFPYFLSEAKASCFINYKQVSNAKEEQRAKRGMMRSQKHRWRMDQRRPFNQTPNYGRKP